ncbi:MAG: hypothetical protein WD771_01020 [Gemmatimonadaceae bacterium]
MVTRLIALFLLAGALLPVAGLIPGGESDPGYLARLSDWGLGAALCAGIGVLATYVRRVRASGSAERGGRGPGDVVAGTGGREHPGGAQGSWFPLLLAIGAFLLYAAVARWVFSARPLLIDEIVHVLQAQSYAAGRLWEAVRLPREFFSILHVVDLGDREFGQYPVGGPAMLVPGVWIGATWLVGPLVGAACAWFFWLLLGSTDPLASLAWRRGTAALFALTPFGVFMFGSHMNHATTLLWLLVAVVALVRAATDETRAPLFGLVTGLGFGIAATIRPLDAAAFALPAAAWLAWRARGGGRAVATLVLSGVGVAAPVAVMLWANAETTGNPFRFGYDLLWGAGHGIGFHRTPWGSIHTPARGLELIGLYFTRLGTYLFETPFPAVLPAAAGLWLARSVSTLDRYLFASGALLLLGYWAYWHDGFFLGPRFLFPLLPLLVLWTARAVPLIRDRLGAASLAWHTIRTAGIAGILYAVVTLAIVRVPTYRNGMTSLRFDVNRAAALAGVHDALVLVQESWGAQLVVRMWAAGLSRADTEFLYRRIDACVLEMTLQGIEHDGVRDGTALERLRPFLVDSGHLVPSHRSADDTEQMLPGVRYPALCEARIASDQLGFLNLAPWRLSRDGNVYARWLPGREAEIAAAFPTRPVYRLRRDGPSEDAPLVWIPLDTWRPD